MAVGAASPPVAGRRPPPAVVSFAGAVVPVVPPGPDWCRAPYRGWPGGAGESGRFGTTMRALAAGRSMCPGATSRPSVGGGGGVAVVDREVPHLAAGDEGGGGVVEAEPVGGAEADEEVGGLGQGHAGSVDAAGVDRHEDDFTGRVPAHQGPGVAGAGEAVVHVGEGGLPVPQDGGAAADALDGVDGGPDAEVESAVDAAGVGPGGELVEDGGRRSAGGEDGAVGRDRAWLAADADDLEPAWWPRSPRSLPAERTTSSVSAPSGVLPPQAGV